MLRLDPLFDRPDQRPHGLELGRQHDDARARIDRQPRVLFVRHDRKQFRDPGVALRRNDAELGQVRSEGVDALGALTDQQIAVRCCINWPCCSADLTCTKRIVGRRTASQIASASAASFLLRLR